ncbi:hypothetical protein DH2020_034342 [Rehmannia glutinosa]|uniref:NAD(P)-binding domain-containing protein n=1 Tax=Rehmannia glutinosa TaxID=99300 RepID=A0ABR0VDE7_REHGL
MELRCMQSPSVSSIPRSVLLEKPFLCGHTIVKLPGHRRTCTDARKLKFLDFRAPASGTTKIKSQAQDSTLSDSGQKDGNLVFVAGATGRVGSRTVRELLKLGFKVRAGVRSIQRAESLVQSVQNMKLEDVAGGTQPTNKFELVECDLEKLDRIKPALGKSSIVICCIGASEKEIFDITGPYRIDYQATKNLIDAGKISSGLGLFLTFCFTTSAKVEQFILLTSLGTNKVGFPAAILNLFWGVLIWKRKAEEALLASGLPYTIVRPGGMERPTDSYKETHNITLSEEDTLFGGQVSNLQVAELMAFMAKNRSLSCCKVVEVIAETSAPLTPLGELLKKIPSQREEVCSFKESDEADGSQPVVANSTFVEKEPEQVIATTATPLSPYTAYEDLKPPTSPTPTPSTGSGATKASKIEITPTSASSTSSSIEVNSLETSSISVDNVIPQTAPKRTNASSPYINYEDLKPPTSPTPTPSTGSGATKTSKIEAMPPAAVNSLETSGISIDNVIPQTAPKRKNASSPYINYEDLKPPSSPTPTPSVSKEEPSIASTTEVTSTLTGGNDVAKSESTDAGEELTKTLASELSPYIAYESKGRPLSPYTMYEDLKPPSSPMPSPRKF